MSKKLLDMIPQELHSVLLTELLESSTTDQLKAAMPPDKLEVLKGDISKRTDAEITGDIERWAKGEK